MFWIIYIFFSVLLSYLFSLFFKNSKVRIFIFNIFLSIFVSVWFVLPGSVNVAPIFVILLLESSIIESNGIQRILRPFFGTFFITLTISFIIYFFRSRN